MINYNELFEKSKVYSTDASGINEAPVNSIILENNKLIELALNFHCKITSKKYDNTMCWHIELNNSEAYIDKETGISLYIKNENEEGKNQYEANSVNDIDVQKPDISEYTKQ